MAESDVGGCKTGQLGSSLELFEGPVLLIFISPWSLVFGLCTSPHNYPAKTSDRYFRLAGWLARTKHQQGHSIAFAFSKIPETKPNCTNTILSYPFQGAWIAKLKLGVDLAGKPRCGVNFVRQAGTNNKPTSTGQYCSGLPQFGSHQAHRPAKCRRQQGDSTHSPSHPTISNMLACQAGSCPPHPCLAGDVLCWL